MNRGEIQPVIQDAFTIFSSNVSSWSNRRLPWCVGKVRYEFIQDVPANLTILNIVTESHNIMNWTGFGDYKIIYGSYRF